MKLFGYPIKVNEDVFFSVFVENVAPKEECEKFACETKFVLGTLGTHAIDQWLSPKECKAIREQYNRKNNNEQ